MLSSVVKATLLNIYLYDLFCQSFYLFEADNSITHINVHIEHGVSRLINPVFHESGNVSAEVNGIFLNSFSKGSVQIFGISVLVFP